MQERLLRYIERHGMMKAGDRVGIAVSGGADSVALLRLLLDVREQLGIVLSVVHFNHKLRGEESEGDEAFVRALAAAHGLELFCESADTKAYAEERKCGVEAAARELRYEFFRGLISPQRTQRDAKEKDEPQGTQGYAGEKGEPQRTQRDGKILDRIATGHTMDDQAETVLLKLLRGAGTRGLAGIHPVLDGERDDGPTIVRPLLDFRRAQLRHYLKRAGQAWREDSSNQEPAFTRNKLRQELMPKLREFNPAIEQVLSEMAEIARAEEEYWEKLVDGRRSTVDGRGATVDGGWSMVDGRRSTVDGDELLTLDLALQRRVVRAAAERHGVGLDFQHVQQILELMAEPATRSEKRVELPNEHDAVLVDRELRIERRCPTENREYEIPLSVPGEVEVSAAGLTIAARLLASGDGNLLDPGQAGSLRVRNWRAGDRYRPRFSSKAKKVKELLQSRLVPARARANWPVVVSDIGGEEVVVWIPMFPPPEDYRAREGEPGVLVEARGLGNCGIGK